MVCLKQYVLIFYFLVNFLNAEDYNVIYINRSNSASQSLNQHRQTSCSSATQFGGYFFRGKDCGSVLELSYSLPSHYGISISIELVYLNDYNNQQVYISFIQSSSSMVANLTGKPSYLSGDCQIKHFYRGGIYNLSDSSKNFQITLQERCFMANEYAVTSLQINVDTCHPSCTTCNGPLINNCTSCPFGSPSSGICSCSNSSNYFMEGSCIAGPCPANYIAQGKACFLRPNCSKTDDSAQICQSCNPSYYLWEGHCLQKCPSGFTLDSQTCQYPFSQYNKDKLNFYLKGALFKNDFSMIEISRLGFSIENGFNPYKDSNQIDISYCGGYQLYGGFYSLINQSKITFPALKFQNKFIQIYFRFILIDYPTTASPSIYVWIGLAQFQITLTGSESISNICGLGGNEVVGNFSQLTTVGATSQNQINLNIYIKIESSIFGIQTGSNPNDHPYFGIREITVIGFDCLPNNCDQCTQHDTCTHCQSGYYLTSPSCSPCLDSNCDICNGNQYSDCSLCKSSYYQKIDDKTCSTCLMIGYYKSINDCLLCDNSCQGCEGSGPNKCTSCFNGKFLQSSDKSCQPCLANCQQCIEGACQVCSGSYTISETSKQCVMCEGLLGYYKENNDCKLCHTECDKCSGPNDNQCTICKDKTKQLTEDTNKCVICKNQSGYFPDNSYCRKCHPDCSECTGLLDTSCSLCKQGTFLKEDDKKCSTCQINGYFIDNNNCLQCDSTCFTCDGSGINKCTSCFEGYYLRSSDKSCQKCEENCLDCIESKCLQCDTNYQIFEKTNQCVICQDEPEYYQDGQQCKSCHSDCKKCNGPNSNDCLICKDNSKQFDEDTNQCVKCEEIPNHYTDNLYCRKCNVSCKECYGPLDSDCKECNTTYFAIQYPNNKRCQQNNNFKYQTQSAQNCKSCENIGVLCSEAFKYSLIVSQNIVLKTDYSDICQICKCQTCQPGYQLYEGECLTDCSTVGSNHYFSSQKGECICKEGYPYRSKNSVNNIQIDCTSFIPYGYYCDSSNYCEKCSVDNCQVCSSAKLCSSCLDGYFLWNNKCQSNCREELHLKENEKNKTCQCQSDYQLEKDESGDYICQIPLKLISIQMINILMQGNKQPSYQGKEYNNFIFIYFNRTPEQKESESITVDFIDQDSTDQSYYKIVFKQILDSCLEVEVESQLNKKFQLIVIQIQKEKETIKMNNAVLVSKSYAQSGKSDVQKSLTQNMESFSSAFTPTEDGSIKIIIGLLKKFQILTSFSNFVQVLLPISLISNQLPPVVKFGSLLGASFVFDQIPSPQEVDFDIASQKNRILESTENNSNNIMYKLRNFGLKNDLYSNFMMVHILTSGLALLILICCSFRVIFSGFQYSMLVVNKSANFLISYLQSSITINILVVIFCLKDGSNIKLTIFQLVIYLIFFIEFIFIIIFRSNQYIFESLPNVFQNINYQVKGAKTYILFSYFKKIFVVCIQIYYFNNAPLCAGITAATFLLSAIYILIFRFFKSTAFNAIKIFQETVIATLFALIAATAKFYTETIEKNPIPDDDLEKSQQLGRVIIVLIMVSILISTIIFLWRLYVTIKDMIDSIKQAKEEKQKLLDSINIQSIIDINIQSTIRNIRITKAQFELTNLEIGTKEIKTESSI